MEYKYIDSDEPIDIQIALDILDISLSNIRLSNLTHKFVKTHYYKMALKWHPDKHNSSDSITAKHRFQRVNEAYLYLITELDITIDDDEPPVVSSNNINDYSPYTFIVTTAIQTLIQSGISDMILVAVKDIIINYNTISATIFSGMDKQTVMEIYKLLYKHQLMFGISNNTLSLVSSIIKERYNNDRIFILNPSLQDLWLNNIYKLFVNDQLYLVPLWHNELYFDSKDGEGDIIVLCNPELPDNISITDNNNIHVTTNIVLDSENYCMLVLNNGSLSVDIGNKIIAIDVNKLYMKKTQTHVIVGEGLARICENDIYNVSQKGDIIVTINFCEQI